VEEKLMEMKSTSRLFALAAALLVGGTLTASAQAPNLSGKTVQMVIGFGPGGGYDLWGRVVARHIGKHLPGNPTVVPQNMPGAGSFTAAAHIYSAAPKDGTVMGIIARDAALGPLTGQEGARFDATKITWLGTPTTETNVCIAYKTSKVKKAEDLLTTEIIVGDTGPGTGTHAYPKALNSLLGMKFKLIGGYPSSSDVFLAMERGEVDGICESLDSVHGKRPDWIEKKTVTLLFQGGAEVNQEIKEIPSILTMAKDADTKQAIEFLYAGQGIGRPFVAPPDLSPEVLKMLRDAFAATMKDPEFIAETKQRKLDLDPEDGAHLEALIKKIYATPKPIVDKVGELIK
jgi:tripartite-type tricarboxylate transporter receptor subunit TctC